MKLPQKTMELINKIDKMSNKERVIFREKLKKEGNKNYLLRNLYYNYETQEWIDQK